MTKKSVEYHTQITDPLTIVRIDSAGHILHKVERKYTTAQLLLTKRESRKWTGSNSTCGLSAVFNGENL